MSKAIDDVAFEVFEALSRYHWPGNLRELENVIEQAVLFCDSGTLGVQNLPALGASYPEAQGFAEGQGYGDAAGYSETHAYPDAQGADEWRHAEPAQAADASVGLKEQVREAMSRLERDLIHRALLQTHGNVTHAARLLKISRKGLQLKMKELGLRERE